MSRVPSVITFTARRKVIAMSPSHQSAATRVLFSVIVIVDMKQITKSDCVGKSQ